MQQHRTPQQTKKSQRGPLDLLHQTSTKLVVKEPRRRSTAGPRRPRTTKPCSGGASSCLSAFVDLKSGPKSRFLWSSPAGGSPGTLPPPDPSPTVVGARLPRRICHLRTSDPAPQQLLPRQGCHRHPIARQRRTAISCIWQSAILHNSSGATERSPTKQSRKGRSKSPSTDAAAVPASAPRHSTPTSSPMPPQTPSEWEKSCGNLFLLSSA